MTTEVPSQKKMVNAVSNIPVEYFKWGTYPDHFKIDMPHRHDFSELLFFTKGGAKHEINYREYQAREGSIHFIPRSKVHFLQREKQSEGFTISFDSKYFEINNTHKFLNPLKNELFVLDLEENRFKQILDQTDTILDQIKQQKGYYRQKCFLLSIELLLNSIAAHVKYSSTQTNIHTNSQLVENFIRLVNNHVHENNNVSWFASKLHVTAKHLSHEVKKHMKISSKKYIQSRLLTSIKKGLIDSNKSIKQIAFDHNLDESALGKIFKKHVGYTMSQYRSYR